MADLVEARRDGRLGERERASLERHLAGCASCRATEQRLERIAAYVRQPLPEDQSPLERQRGRLALLRAAVRPRAKRRPPAGPVALVLLGAAALVVAERAHWSSFASHPPRPAEPGSAPNPARAQLAAHLPSPPLPSPPLPPPALPKVGAADVAEPRATIQASPEARFDRRSFDGLDRVDLFDGALDLEVDPLGPDQRFVVTTDDAEVEVRGTVFRVEAKLGQLTAVSVTEGKVAVRRGGEVALLFAGDVWPSPSARGPSSTSEPPRPAAPATATAVALGQRSPRPRTHAHGTDEGAGGGQEASHDQGRSEASRAFAKGMSLIEHGDDAAAARELEAFRAAHPGDPRAEDAAFLAIVSLQRAGRAADAKAAAARFLELYPSSVRAAAVKAMANAP